MKLEQAKSASAGGSDVVRTLTVGLAAARPRSAERLAPRRGSVYTPSTMCSRYNSLLLLALGLSRPWAHS